LTRNGSVFRLLWLLPIIRDRMERAVAKKCDGDEPDNVLDGYTSDTDFPPHRGRSAGVTTSGLSVGLKNEMDQIEDLGRPL
jgi:hypothetical protein